MYIPQLKNKGQVTVSVCVHAWACKISTNVAATKSRRTRKGHIRDSRVMSSVATWYNFVNGENLSVMLQLQLLLVYVTVAFLTHNVHQTAEIILPNFMENSVRFQAWITGCGISAYECLMGAKATWPPGWYLLGGCVLCLSGTRHPWCPSAQCHLCPLIIVMTGVTTQLLRCSLSAQNKTKLLFRVGP